jgi:hypothetical protein
MARHKTVVVKCSVQDAIESAGNEVAELAEEMVSWRDNLEDKLSHTDKYTQVNEAADALENADLSSLADTLVQALEAAEEESEFRDGCREHVVGTPCGRCQWDGRPRHRPGWHSVVVFDPPQLSEKRPGQFWLGKIGGKDRYADGYGGVPNVTTVLNFQAEVTRVRADNDRVGDVCDNIPARWPDSPAVKPLPGLAEVTGKEITYTEAQAYKGKSLSRADRLDNALTGARYAIDEIKAALAAAKHVETVQDAIAGDADAIAAAGGGEELPIDESVEERLEAIEEALTEFEGAVDDLLGNVEFPGMYG